MGLSLLWPEPDCPVRAAENPHCQPSRSRPGMIVLAPKQRLSEAELHHEWPPTPTPRVQNANAADERRLRAGQEPLRQQCGKQGLTPKFSRGHAHTGPSDFPNALGRGRRLQLVVGPHCARSPQMIDQSSSVMSTGTKTVVPVMLNAALTPPRPSFAANRALSDGHLRAASSIDTVRERVPSVLILNGSRQGSGQISVMTL